MGGRDVNAVIEGTGSKGREKHNGEGGMKAIPGLLLFVLLVYAGIQVGHAVFQDKRDKLVVKEVRVLKNQGGLFGELRLGLRADGVVVWKGEFENGQIVSFISLVDTNGKLYSK